MTESKILLNQIKEKFLNKENLTIADLKQIFEIYPKVRYNSIKKNIENSRIIKIVREENELTSWDIFLLLKDGKEIETQYCPVCGCIMHAGRKEWNKTCGSNYCKNKYKVETIKNTCMEKYGVENVFCLKSTKDKIKKFYQENYGVDSAAQVKEVQDKARKTNLERYGAENPFASEEIKEKIKNRNLELHGAEYPSYIPEIIKKRSKTRGDNGYKKLLSLEFTEPAFSRDEWKGHHTSRDGIIYEWRCKLCGKIFYSNINGICSYPHCPDCFPCKCSVGQKEVYEFIKTCGVREKDLMFNTRVIIPPLEIDIFIKNKNIAFEYNGVFWHSGIVEDKNITRDYHIGKIKECEKKNIKLFHISENLWREKPQNAKFLIMSVLGFEQKINKISNYKYNIIIKNDIASVVEFKEFNNGIYLMTMSNVLDNVDFLYIINDFKSSVNNVSEIKYIKDLSFYTNNKEDLIFDSSYSVSPQKIYYKKTLPYERVYVNSSENGKYLDVWDCGKTIYSKKYA